MVLSIKRRRGTLSRRACALTLALLLAGLAAVAQGLYFPRLTEDGLKKKNGTVVDIGNASQGYIQVQHRASAKRLKVRISRDESTYTYDLNQKGEFEVFPLQMGSGSYKVRVYEQVKGTKYSAVSSISFSADIADEMLPYLYPNQYVSYEADSALVTEALSLCEGVTDDGEKAQIIESYVGRRFMYDYMKAITISSATTYLPDLDEVFRTQKGICFDFAAMVCAMLRVQGIPTQLVVGYADEKYHAWNRAYIDGEWRLIDTTAAITGVTVKQYRPERQY